MPEGARLQLDYYKNGIMHAVVAEAIVASTLLADPNGMPTPDAPIPRVRARERARKLSRILKYEFIFSPGVDFDSLFDDAVRTLSKEGVVGGGEGGLFVEPSRASYARLFAGSIEHFLEAYAFAARGLSLLREEAKTERTLLQEILEIAQKSFLTGDLKRFESANKLIFENALRYFRDEGVLGEVPAEDEGDKGLVQLAPAYASDEALAALEKSIRALMAKAE